MVHISINSVLRCVKSHATLHTSCTILLLLASDSSLRKSPKVMKPVGPYRNINRSISTSVFSLNFQVHIVLK